MSIFICVNKNGLSLEFLTNLQILASSHPDSQYNRQDSDQSYLALETGILEPWQQPIDWQTTAEGSGAVISVPLQFFLQVSGLLAWLVHDLLPLPVDSLQVSLVSFALDGSVHSGSN